MEKLFRESSIKNEVEILNLKIQLLKLKIE